MGRDKSRMRLGTRTLLGHVRANARATNLPVRVIRRDLVSRCGPLGGIFTALKTTRAKAVLFLACDMPFVSANRLRQMVERVPNKGLALFTKGDVAGFPFILRREVFAVVEGQLAKKSFSLQALAKACKAKSFRVSAAEAAGLFNVNTPEDWAKARRIFGQKS